MASDYSLVGAHLLRKWLWSKLEGFVWNGTDQAFVDYGPGKVNLIPIIPSQQVPELTDVAGGAPFIVYNYVQQGYDEWWRCRETCAFAIYDANEARLRAIFNYMVDLLKRYDITASEINDFTGASPFEFKYVRVATAVGPGNFTDEGGRLGAQVVAGYEYTHPVGSTGLRV